MKIICKKDKTMHQHSKRRLRQRRRYCQPKGKEGLILLVGPPNVGKSVVFTILTGQYVEVSNYPGTTVEVFHGLANFPPFTKVVDTPGINNLFPHSLDEEVARDIVLKNKDKSTVILIVDAKNLRRGLLLATQLAEIGVPFVFNLNMADEAEKLGLSIDLTQLSEKLKTEVNTTVAIEKRGVNELKEKLGLARQSDFYPRFDQKIEEAISELATLLPKPSTRYEALAVLINDRFYLSKLASKIERKSFQKILKLREELASSYSDPLAFVIESHRAYFVENLVKKVLSQKEKKTEEKVSTFFDQLALHPIFGFFLLAFVLYFVYLFVGVLGAQIVVDFTENTIFNKLINPIWLKLAEFLPWKLLKDFLVGNYGLLTMGLTYALAIVLPIVLFFFLAFSLLEDSGYLPRLATLLNRTFKVMGLNGKAVLPMILGLGCDTMATLTTRILDTPKERIIATLLLALGIPCSAQLGVITGLLGGLSFKALIIFVLVIASQLILVGFLASHLISGEASDFLIEIPPLRIPKISNIILKTSYRVEWYIKEAVPLFLLGTALLFFLDFSGFLKIIENLLRPIITSFLGLPVETTTAFILGFLRRDYGAAGLYKLAKAGLLNPQQILVSLVTITLFVPCIANFLVIIKERGWKVALAIVSFIFPFAILIGGVLNWLLNYLSIKI